MIDVNKQIVYIEAMITTFANKETEKLFTTGINDQWRICFMFANGEATQVEITDYHQGELYGY